ncbi:MAG: tRNA epoxyqueuosine(34) reductase QueG [Alphaproteobacteria bacterium]|nr:tRNA epoxyqueuosine(34) reductase QueG [Alphaproteobacteria bacterium]
MTASPDPKTAIRRMALDLGFDAVGFAPAHLDAVHGENLKRFVDEGRHGTMAWMETRQEQRASPDGLWPDANSVVVLGVNYGPPKTPAPNPPDRATISAYAQNRDYHDLVKKRLKALGRWMAAEFGCELKVFVDTAPVLEKPLAQLAGIGWQGKHTNVVSREFGPWLVLGEVFTTLELEPDPPEPDHCGRCTACLDACPTGALEPYRMDARRCISYLTIEYKGEIDPDLAASMGNRVYGCDACLAACPWTKFTRPHHEPWFAPRAELTAPRLSDLAGLDEDGFRELFRQSPVKRAGWAGMMRNVRIARKNEGLDD